jgi:hypothetical protein
VGRASLSSIARRTIVGQPMASSTHIAPVRAISHPPWRRTAPWSTQSGGDYAHVFMPEDGVGTAR